MHKIQISILKILSHPGEDIQRLNHEHEDSGWWRSSDEHRNLLPLQEKKSSSCKATSRSDEMPEMFCPTQHNVRAQFASGSFFLNYIVKHLELLLVDKRGKLLLFFIQPNYICQMASLPWAAAAGCVTNVNQPDTHSVFLVVGETRAAGGNLHRDIRSWNWTQDFIAVGQEH